MLEATLAQAGVPVAARIEAPGTIDGGDTLWLDRETLLVGRGYRTNASGVEQLRAAFPDAEVLSYDLPHWNGRAEVMHLMSLISPLADDLVLVYPRLAPVRLLELLAERGIDVVEVRTRSSSRWGRTCSRSGRGSRSRSRATTRRGAGWRRRVSRCCSTKETRSRGRATAVDLPDAAGAAPVNLFEAIAAGDEDAREELERNPESAGERSADGQSPVLFALHNGRADLVDPILDANPRSTSSTRPRSVAPAGSRSCSRPRSPRLRSLVGRLDTASPGRALRPAQRADLLLEHGADPAARDGEGRTPAEIAVGDTRELFGAGE